MPHTPRWYTRLVNRGDGAPRPTTGNVVRIDASPPRSWTDVLTLKPRGITKEILIEGCTTTVITTVKPMTREEATREAARWYTGTREAQWRRLR